MPATRAPAIRHRDTSKSKGAVAPREVYTPLRKEPSRSLICHRSQEKFARLIDLFDFNHFFKFFFFLDDMIVADDFL